MNIKFNAGLSAIQQQLKYQTYVIMTLLCLCVLSLSVNIGIVMDMINIPSDIKPTEVTTNVNNIQGIQQQFPYAALNNDISTIINTPQTSLVRKENTNTTETETNNEIKETPVIENTTETKIETSVITEEPINPSTGLDENISSIIFPETELTGNEKLDKEAFKKAVADVAPNLTDTVDALFENYEKYGLKPSFPLAVACLESGYGKSSLAKNKNNLYGMNAYAANGLTAYQHAFTYTSKTESVLDFGERINSYYIGKGLTTLERINSKYCPNNSEWASNVRSIKNRIEAKYEHYLVA